MSEVHDEMMSVEEIHVLLLYLLEQVNLVSERTGIPYFAHAGTLIGVLRHKGFIPWDDDMDLMIKREDYEAFVTACTQFFPDQVVIRTRENDPYFCEEYIKICFRDEVSGFSELSIDVFVLDETDPDRKLFRWFQNMIIRTARPLKLYKVSRRADFMGAYRPNNIFKRILVAAGSVLPLKWLNDAQSWAMSAEQHTTDYVVDWGSIAGYKKATHPKYFFEGTEQLPFENTTIQASVHALEMVEHIYQKHPWRVIPPPEKRKTHNVRRIVNKALDYDLISKEVKG